MSGKKILELDREDQERSNLPGARQLGPVLFGMALRLTRS